MGTGAAAQLSLEPRIGEILVTGDVRCPDARLVVEDDPRPCRKREPVGSAEVGGNASLEHPGFYRGEQAEVVGHGQTRRVDRDEDVGRTLPTFVAQAFQQFVLLGLDAVDPYAGLPGEVGVEGLVGLVVARRIQVEFGVGQGWLRNQGGNEHQTAFFHGGSPWGGCVGPAW